VEQPEADNADRGEYQHGIHQSDSIQQQYVYAAKQRIDNKAAQYEQCTVYQEDTPIRQRIFGKIPIQQLIERGSHILKLLLLKRGKGTNIP
jgi:hypothetical protein